MRWRVERIQATICESEWTWAFAWLPVKLDDGSWIWFEGYQFRRIRAHGDARFYHLFERTERRSGPERII